MRLRIPLIIAFICGFGMIAQFFIPHPQSQKIYTTALDWLIIIYIFMLVFGVRSLCISHTRKIKKQKKGWAYSVITLLALAVTTGIGVLGGVGEGAPISKIFTYMQMPMQATMFSLLAFFITSAAFRAFKARTLEATLLLVIAVIVMFGRIPIGERLFPKLPDIVEWLLMYPNMAAQRGILIGIGLGAIGTALKIILGIEKGYLGGGG